MRLSWRDFAATLVMCAIMALYWLHQDGSTGWLVSSTRGTTAAVLVLGAVGCGLGRAEDLYREDRTRGTTVLAVWLSVLGALALLAAVAGLFTGAGYALDTLVGSTTALWATATLRRTFAGPDPAERPAAPERGPDNHETIDRQPSSRTPGRGGTVKPGTR